MLAMRAGFLESGQVENKGVKKMQKKLFALGDRVVTLSASLIKT